MGKDSYKKIIPVMGGEVFNMRDAVHHYHTNSSSFHKYVLKIFSWFAKCGNDETHRNTLE